MSAVRRVATLVAVVALGAAIVKITRENDRRKDVMQAINSDLHNIATSQEAYFADYSTYATELSAQQYRATHGATVRILRADATSWAAAATHPGTPLTCTSVTVRKVSSWWPPVCE